MATFALKKNNFNVQKTIEELLGCNGILEGVNCKYSKHSYFLFISTRIFTPGPWLVFAFRHSDKHCI
jgi:hypothetical protein